jgi:O-antigen/teichoic acid export membrane protein
MQVLLPIFTKMSVASDQQGINKIIIDGTKYVTILLSFIIFLLIIAVKEIFTLYVGEKYSILSPWMILWLLTLLLSHRNVMTSLVFTEKNLKSIVIMGAIAMILAITGYIILVPKYGVGGVVIGFTIHEMIHTLFYYLYFLPNKFQIDTKYVFSHSVLPVWVVLGGACGIFFIILSNIDISIPIWLSAIIKCSLLGVVMLIFVWFVLLKKNDKKFLLNNLV